MNKAKIKVIGDNYKQVLEVVNQIRELFIPNMTQSPLLDGEPSGYHCFITVYLGDDEDE